MGECIMQNFERGEIQFPVSISRKSSSPRGKPTGLGRTPALEVPSLDKSFKAPMPRNRATKNQNLRFAGLKWRLEDLMSFSSCRCFVMGEVEDKVSRELKE